MAECVGFVLGRGGLVYNTDEKSARKYTPSCQDGKTHSERFKRLILTKRRKLIKTSFPLFSE